ncbi:MAG: quinolinate synthase NadA [Lachnospiraceae bacterium]|nr:quinolinate synthase NadA [Lachnospiraceae bacterium]
MTTREMQDEIIRLKKEKDICILVHAYISHDVWEVADYVGDSYGLSKQAASAPQQNVLMCGVRFMAETCKILSPEKRVYLSHPDAGCPMAEQIDRELIEAYKEKNPDTTVVAYINTTADLKTVCDVCVTSASALKIVNNIENKKILFIPDRNLGGWIKEKCPDKEIELMQGGCPSHALLRKEDVERMKAKYPNAQVLVHPESRKEVVDLADYVGSTTGIMKFAKESDNKEFIIGTENSIVQHLQMDCPEKRFYELSKDCVCRNMKLTTLADVYNFVKYGEAEEILMEEDVRLKALAPINKMLELGG